MPSLNFLSTFTLALFLNACAPDIQSPAPPEFQNHLVTDSLLKNSTTIEKKLQNLPTYRTDNSSLSAFLDEAELTATDEGKRILQMGRAMIDAQTIIVGSCWDYIFAVYKNAGFPDKNQSVLYSAKKAGPYAAPEKIEAGDWLYIINHSFGDIEHSGIFIGWTNAALGEALLLSYPGGDSMRPARYKIYDLSSVYHIIRPKKGTALSLHALVTPSPAPTATPDAEPTPDASAAEASPTATPEA